MLPDRVSNPGPLTYESGALPIALRGPAGLGVCVCMCAGVGVSYGRYEHETGNILYTRYIVTTSSTEPYRK